MNRICLDPGHGGKDPGATYHDLLEKDVNLQVALHVVEHLDREIWYCLTRAWDQTLTLQERCDMSNNMNVDAFVSIHCNADPDTDDPGMPEAKGEEIWIYDGSNEGLKLAQCLAIEIDNTFPDEPFRGIKETTAFYVLKHTKSPAALIEIGFIDKSSSQEAFTDDQTLQKIGKLIANGIEKYLQGAQHE